MREILFRGKSKNSGRWVYGDLITQRYNSRQGIHIYEKNDKLQSGYQFVRIDKNTIGQYTGLTDKNGKKIFEGDILEYEFDDIGKQKAYVYWNETYSSFQLNVLTDNFAYSPIDGGKVIGNVWDNPELMEVQDVKNS